MKNPLLQNIITQTAKQLQAHYGFVGIADSPNMAMLNSTDADGNDIIIKIEVRESE